MRLYFWQVAIVIFLALNSGFASPGVVVQGQTGTVIENQRLSSTTGPCLTITNSTDITVRNSEIGPCGSNAISITGGTGIKILDSYIHAEVPAVLANKAGCCDSGDNIYAINTTNLLVQGNVIAWGEANIWLANGVTNAVIKGNFLLNPQNNGSRGHQIGVAGTSSSVTIDRNYLLSSSNTSRYIHAARQEDAINIQGPAGPLVQNNYIQGGLSASGCGIIAEEGTNNANFNHNVLVDTGQTGICIEAGSNHVVDANQITGTNPITGGGNTAIIVYNAHPDRLGCGRVTVINNTARWVKPNGSESAYWNGGGCGPVEMRGNTFDAAARVLLMPTDQRLPPPAIPPLPQRCVVASPFSKQTSRPKCPSLGSGRNDRTQP